MKMFFYGMALIVSMAGCSTTNTPTSDNSKQGDNKYSVSESIGSGGPIYYLIKNNGQWKASKTSNTLDDNVEQVSVVGHTIYLDARDGRDRNGICFVHVAGSREKDGYGLCNSEFKKTATVANALTSPFAAINLVVGQYSFRLSGSGVDTEYLSSIVQSSGLITMIEQDRQAATQEAEAIRQKGAAIRQKIEQEKMAADQQAELGDANAKYQRGLFYLGVAGFNTDAEKWFEKAAIAGSADALFKLGAFQKDHYSNETEAERLWKKSAQGGSIAAQAALNDLISERNRKADQLMRERQQQARKLAQVKEVGQAVCTSFSGTEKRVIGVDNYAGKNIYGAAESRTFKMRGFTEGANGNKIQVRIGGIQKFDGRGNNLGNTDRVDGETVYQNGAVIWEDASSWSPC